jgi:hypothetical protein
MAIDLAEVLPFPRRQHPLGCAAENARRIPRYAAAGAAATLAARIPSRRRRATAHPAAASPSNVQTTAEPRKPRTTRGALSGMKASRRGTDIPATVRLILCSIKYISKQRG